MYFLAAASSSAVAPFSAIRFTTSRMTSSVSAARSERVAVEITSAGGVIVVHQRELTL